MRLVDDGDEVERAREAIMQRTMAVSKTIPGSMARTMRSSRLPILGLLMAMFMAIIMAMAMASAEQAIAAEEMKDRQSPTREPLTVVGGPALKVEIAKTPAQRSRGLMERDSLPENAGMLFLYDAEQPGSNAYWMYKTRIPLDIAFVDSGGVIRSLKTMPPCREAQSSRCPVYPAGAPFRAALETNAGYFERHGIREGDRIDLTPWLASP